MIISRIRNATKINLFRKFSKKYMSTNKIQRVTKVGWVCSFQRAAIKTHLNKFNLKKKKKNVYTLHVFPEECSCLSNKQTSSCITCLVTCIKSHYLRSSTVNYQIILYNQGVAQTTTKARNQIQAF